MNKHHSKIWLVLLITCVVSACSLNKEVIGEYHSPKSGIVNNLLGRDYYTYERMLFSKDSTFNFISGGCLGTLSYTGLWRVQSDTIYLKVNESVNEYVSAYSVDRGILKPIIAEKGLVTVYELKKK